MAAQPENIEVNHCLNAKKSFPSVINSVNEIQAVNKNSREAIEKLEEELEKEKKKSDEEKHKYEDVLMEVESLEATKAKIEAELKEVLNNNRILRDICSESCQNLNQSANEAMLKLREIINFSMKMKDTANKMNKSVDGSTSNLRSCGVNTDISGESYGSSAFSDDIILNKSNIIEQLTNNNYDLERQIEALTNTNYSNEWMMVLVDEWKELRLKASQEKHSIDH